MPVKTSLHLDSSAVLIGSSSSKAAKQTVSITTTATSDGDRAGDGADGDLATGQITVLNA